MGFGGWVEALGRHRITHLQTFRSTKILDYVVCVSFLKFRGQSSAVDERSPKIASVSNCPLCHVNIRALGSILNQDVHNVSGLLYHTETKLNSCIRARSRTRYISDEPYSSRYGLRTLPFFSCKRQNKLKPLCPNHVPPEEP